MSEFYQSFNRCGSFGGNGGVQQQLCEAVANNDLEDFQLALDMGADPLIPNDSGVCVYEMCLSTYGRVEFVEECLKNDCSPHYLNHRLNKAAINYAADSKDPRIVDVILSHPNIMVNNTFCHLTPLNSLAINVNNENINDVIECFERLIFYGASTTIGDDTGKNPANHLMLNAKLNAFNKKKILQEFENFVKHKRELINSELESLQPEASFAAKFKKRRPDGKIKLELMEYDLEDVAPKIHTEEDQFNMYLFFNSIKHRDRITFDSLMGTNIDCNSKISEQSPLECALDAGNCYALKRLLDRPDVSIQSVECPLSLIIKNMKDDSGNYRKCLYMLLKHKEVDINESDSMGCTALHYAIDERNDEAIVELLKRGAFLGAKSFNDELSIEGISPALLKECFDNCISTHDFSRISLKYDNFKCSSNLIHRHHQRGGQGHQKEMAPLSFMAQSDDHRHLLDHPLITSFLEHKWHQFSLIFYLNFLCFIFFAVSVMTHTILKFSNTDAQKTLQAFHIMSWIGIIYMVIRECLQLITLPRQYFRSFANYLELTLIIFAIINCKDLNIESQKKKVIAVITLLLIAMELFLLCGCLPILSMSTHMLMLEEVCKSFLKSFLLYSIFVVTFSLCFYILFGTEAQAQKPDDGKDGDGGGDFNKFPSPLKAIVKTVVMLTGEFDAGSLEFNSLFSYLFFLLFVFLMTIVLYNLLNGLAVSDIQTIMGQAKQNGTISRIELLNRYEDVVIGHSLYERFFRLYSVNAKSNDIPLDFSNDENPQISRDTLEDALSILEEKKLTSKKQQRLRNNENRFNSIESKLSDICKRLDFKC